MQHHDITQKIIGAAFKVYNTMGFGYLESVCEKSLMIELRRLGIKAENQKPIIVHYENEVVGEFVGDVVVEDEIIIELKSVRRVTIAHETQLVNYLTATKKDVGLLLNFGQQKVEVKRKVRTLPFDGLSS